MGVQPTIVASGSCGICNHALLIINPSHRPVNDIFYRNASVWPVDSAQERKGSSNNSAVNAPLLQCRAIALSEKLPGSFGVVPNADQAAPVKSCGIVVTPRSAGLASPGQITPAPRSREMSVLAYPASRRISSVC